LGFCRWDYFCFESKKGCLELMFRNVFEGNADGAIWFEQGFSFSLVYDMELALNLDI
jgi:hypothetical protein